MSKNKIKVKVCGTEFNILSEDNEEYTQKIASVVDRKMKQTLETNPRVSISNIAILTALEFCDLSKKFADQTENMKINSMNILRRHKRLVKRLMMPEKKQKSFARKLKL
ncbi:MAG: cell division protein ZapA [Pseudoruminococcus massiliensis]